MSEHFNSLLEKIKTTEIADKSDIIIELSQLKDQLAQKLESKDQSGLDEAIKIKEKIKVALDKLKTNAHELEDTIDSYYAEVEAQIVATQGELSGLADEVAEAADKEESRWDKWNPFKSTDMGTWKAKVGKGLLSLLSIATIVPALANNPQLKAIEERIKSWAGISTAPATKAEATASTVSTPETLEDMSRDALAAKLQEHPENFKDPSKMKRLSAMEQEALLAMYKVMLKYPTVRFTSWLRTEEEQKALADSGHETAENSFHLYGLGFDIGKSTDHPPAYTLQEVQKYITENMNQTVAIVHGSGEQEHVHVHAKHEQIAANKRTDDKLRKEGIA